MAQPGTRAVLPRRARAWCCGAWARACGAAACVAWAGAAHAACFTDSEAATVVAQFMDKQPLPHPQGLTAADAACTRRKVQGLLAQSLGRPVGYTVALGSRALQQRFRHAGPVWGALYAPMLLPGDSTLAARFGARPQFQAALLLRVSEVRINRARTPQEVLAGVDQVIPFIELPDLLVQQPERLDGLGLMALNAGMRLGVVGEPLPVARSAAFEQALRDMQVVVRADGAELGRSRGADVLDHPLNAVVWLVQQLAREGEPLRKGDLVSVGGLSAPRRPRPGTVVEVRFEGLPQTPAVRVGFK